MACTRPASPAESRATLSVTGAVVTPLSVTVTPGSRPLTTLVADDTVYAPTPVPTVSWASVAVVSVRNPPTFALNSDPATFAPCLAPVAFEPIWSRNVLSPTCTAVAVTPAFALLIAATTVARLPSPTETFLPVIVPARKPPENVAVIAPVAALSTALPPASILVIVWSAPPSIETLPSVPRRAAPSMLSESVASAFPPVTRRLAGTAFPARGDRSACWSPRRRRPSRRRRRRRPPLAPRQRAGCACTCRARA